MDIIKAKKYNFYGVYGISPKQLRQHEKLYDGYVNKLNEIKKKLIEKDSYINPNSTYSRLRCLELGQSYSLNGVKLHEYYFENLGGVSKKPYGPIYEKIINKYGNINDFFMKYKAIGLSVRGWVNLVWDPLFQDIEIIGQDSHDIGSTIETIPLLVMDVYEHAYMIDFGINKLEYIDVFINNINWDVVNYRFQNINFKG